MTVFSSPKNPESEHKITNSLSLVNWSNKTLNPWVKMFRISSHFKTSSSSWWEFRKNYFSLSRSLFLFTILRLSLVNLFSLELYKHFIPCRFRLISNLCLSLVIKMIIFGLTFEGKNHILKRLCNWLNVTGA